MLLLVQLPGAQQVGVTDDGGKGSLQLMGKRRDKILPGPHRLLQLAYGVLQHICHAVEALCKLPQLVVADLPCAIAVISLRHLPGGACQNPDGLCQPCTNQEHHHRTDGKHGRRHLSVNGKARDALLENLCDILLDLQVQIPVQGIHHDPRMYIIPFPLA